MREIRVSTSVFARIWALREEGEETESEILDRILSGSRVAPADATQTSPRNVGANKVKWRDDVVTALEELGGEADLDEIYLVVRANRRAAGRTVPRSTDAIVRRELEYNSSDSDSFTRKQDLFRSVNGIGGGRWALR